MCLPLSFLFHCFFPGILRLNSCPFSPRRSVTLCLGSGQAGFTATPGRRLCFSPTNALSPAGAQQTNFASKPSSVAISDTSTALAVSTLSVTMAPGASPDLYSSRQIVGPLAMAAAAAASMLASNINDPITAATVMNPENVIASISDSGSDLRTSIEPALLPFGSSPASSSGRAHTPLFQMSSPKKGSKSPVISSGLVAALATQDLSNPPLSVSSSPMPPPLLSLRPIRPSCEDSGLACRMDLHDLGKPPETPK
ncbi:unnamed protein product [Protopolystoma xenopodis]|uniref:Uncharacterized protein n=1 Tax=Protopolystoma xenopodis TaxID=117903 RepID=A0A448XS55_9PLAT|nr:unnamed protein product [Protopolystoma xenopodis]